MPKPGVPTSHFTAVFAIHACVAQIDGCICMETVRSAVTKLRPATVIAVDAVIAAFGLSKPLMTGAETKGACNTVIGEQYNVNICNHRPPNKRCKDANRVSRTVKGKGP